MEIRETVQEILIPTYVEAPKPATAKPPLFAGVSDDDLLTYGVPPEWLPDVRQVDEDSLLSLAGRLPGEAAEAAPGTGHWRQAASTSASRAGDESARSSRRTTPIPGDEQCRGTSACPGVPVG